MSDHKKDKLSADAERTLKAARAEAHDASAAAKPKDAPAAAAPNPEKTEPKGAGKAEALDTAGRKAKKSAFLADILARNGAEAELIAQYTQAAEEAHIAHQGAEGESSGAAAEKSLQNRAAQAEESEARRAAKPKSLTDRFIEDADQLFEEEHEGFEKILDAEAEIVTSENRMVKVLAAMSKQFSPGQILVVPWQKAILYVFTGCLCLLIQTQSLNMFQNNMPQLEAYFQASLVESMWLISAYMAPYASFTVLLVKVRSQVGTDRFAFIALSCFIAVCCLDIAFTDYNSALFMRFLSGLATAPISTIGILYILEPFIIARKVNIGMTLSMMFISLGTPLARLISPFMLADSGVSAFYFFEIGLCCLTLMMVYFLRLAPLPQTHILEKLDFISYPLFGIAVGLYAAMLPLGKYYWWQEANWIGISFAVSLFCLTCSMLIELNRKTPFLDLRWLFSPEMLHITIVMLSFRMLISDQVGLLSIYFTFFDLQNDQLVTLYSFIALGIIAGALICFIFLKPGGGDYLYLLGAVAITVGSFADSFSTNLTRPVDMYFTQWLIGFGTTLFMAVSFSKGLLAAFTLGKSQYLTSFVAAFLFTQSTGGLAGSAFFGTIQIYFEKFHSYILTQYLTLTNPQVAGRIDALGSVYGNILTDPALRQAQGISALAKQATREANVLAYNDVFRIYGWIGITLFCLLIIRILLKRYFVARAAEIEARQGQNLTPPPANAAAAAAG